MLPDKNELNDELIEQISGGEDCQIKTGQKTEATKSKDGTIFHTCPNCGMTYTAAKRRTDGYCPNCETQIISKIAPIGDIKTTIPELSNTERFVKIH